MRIPFTILLLALVPGMAPPQETTKFSVTTNLVVVNVEVKDRDGKAVDNLGRDDFELLEDGKPQRIAVFEYQRLEPQTTPPPVVERTAAPKPASPVVQGAITPSKPGEIRYRDRRLIVLFFDLSSMAVEEQIRARRAAEEFITKKMTPADMMAVMTFSSELKVLQDFTGDRDLLSEAINKLRIGEGSDLAESNEVDESAVDTGAAFSPDTSEFDIFNTDRKLSALESASKMLSSLPEKKVLVYFSSGIGRTGMENESQLRSTVNAAVKSNVAFYPVDARGLVAEAPGGDTRTGAIRGSGMYSGQTQQQRRQRFTGQQETLYTLASDTGGKALFDNNQLSLGIVQAQNDTTSYYILGYYSTNAAADGRYRRVAVRVKSQSKLKLDYRAGYFAPKSFDKYNATDKERQLEEALMLGDPITDLPLALEVDYFRRARDRYIVPVSVKIPGSEIQLAQKRGREEARLDFIAEVRDERGRPIGSVRDFITIKLTGSNEGRMASHQLHYDTAFTLPPGVYDLKFVARENETGKIGTFETKFTVPDLDKENSYLRISSVIWGNQREPLDQAVGAAESKTKLLKSHPLVKDGQKLIPSITKVFREGQSLYVAFEVYEPSTATGKQPVALSAGISLFGRKGKVLESEPVSITSKADPKSPSLPVEFQVPLTEIQPGRYVCQLSVVDRTGAKFAFDRTPLVVLPPLKQP